MEFKISVNPQTRRTIETLKKQGGNNNLSPDKIDGFLKTADQGGYLGKGHQLQPFLGNLVETLMSKYTPNKKVNISLKGEIFSTDHLVISLQYQHLLYWLSALGSGTWEGFKKHCETLQIPPDYKRLRRLKLLGHIELSENGDRWSITPTTLVKINSKLDVQEFVVCGQRSIKLVEFLQEYADVNVMEQPQGKAPPCLHIKTTNVQELIEKSGVTIVNAGEVSLKLAEILPNLKKWQQNLKYLQGIVTHNYEMQYFDVKKDDFVCCDYPRDSGMYRLHSLKGKNNYGHTLFFDQERDIWLQADWNGLRFLAIQYQGICCQAWYDSKTQYLAIPNKQQWPEIYERALVLASGHLPRYKDGWLLYRNVSKKIVRQLSDKLNIKWEEASIYV